MTTNRSATLSALTAAGVLWGVTVPLIKIALAGWGPVWLTVVRFALAAVPLLFVADRAPLRRAASPRVVFWGATGYALVIVLQGLGIERTSVAHASLIIGLTPLLAAIATVALGRARVGRTAWTGFALAFAGIALVATSGGGSASLGGDLLILVSVLLSATFLLAQDRLLVDRDPLAVTAVQFAASALLAAPLAVAVEGAPALPSSTAPIVAALALTVLGTLLPYALFAYAQSRVSPGLAGAFLNIEPVVGFGAGVIAFGDPFGPLQLLGGLTVLAGLALTAAPAQTSPLPHPSHYPSWGIRPPGRGRGGGPCRCRSCRRGWRWTRTAATGRACRRRSVSAARRGL
ncbi:DMT family transporter [Nonomuraea sp. NPDC003201]